MQQAILPRQSALWRGGLLILLGLSLLAPAHAQTSERELTVEGALHLATQMLAKDAKQPLGLYLARLVVALEPNHREGLLLLSAVHDQLPIEEPSEQVLDNGLTFGGFLLRQGDEQAKQTGARAQAWANLYYGLGLSLAPRHERALSLALRLKRPLNDLGVEALLTAVAPPVVPVASTPASPAGGAAATTPAAGGAAATVVAGTVEQRLRAVAVAEMEISSRYPLTVVNQLNRLLQNSGVLIRPKAAGLNVAHENLRDGVPYFYARYVEGGGRMDGGQGDENRGGEPERQRYLTLRQTSAWRAMVLLCRQVGVGYKVVGQEVHLVNPDEPGAVYEKVITVTADSLANEFGGSLTRALAKYKEQLVEVTGVLDGYAAPTLGRTTLTLNSDKIRLLFGKEEDLRGPLAELKTAYDGEKERQAAMRRSGSSYWSYGDMSSTGRGGIELTVVGRCTGYRGGRVVLEDCQEPTWRRR